MQKSVGKGSGSSCVFKKSVHLFSMSISRREMRLTRGVRRTGPIDRQLLMFSSVLFAGRAVECVPAFFSCFDKVSIRNSGLLRTSDCTLGRRGG